MGCCSKKPVDIAGQADDAKANGVAPASTRKCRDVLCVVLFAVFWVGMLAIAAVGFMNGEPKRLLYGTDYNGTTCGTGKQADKPLTFYPRITQDLLEQATNPSLSTTTDFSFYGVCVSTCPAPGTYICNDDAEEEIQSDTSLATEAEREAERKRLATSLTLLGSERQCWLVAMPSEKVFYRCLQVTQSNSTAVETCVVPGDSPEYYDDINGVLIPNDKCEVKRVRTVSETTGPAQDNPLYSTLQTAGATLGRVIGDVEETWSVVLLCGGLLALAFGFVFILLLRFCAGCIVWVSLWSFVLLLLCFALVLATKGGVIGDAQLSALTTALEDAAAAAGVNATDSSASLALELPETLRASEDKRQVYAVASYITFALTGVALLLVCFFQKKIRIAVGIVKETSRALAHLPLLALFPIIPFIMLLALFGYVAIVAAYIYSSGELQLADMTGELAAQAGQNVTAQTTVLNTVSADQTMQMLVAYHFFGFLWTAQLINAISMCTIAGAVSRYYWSRNKTRDEMGPFPVLTSFKNCFRYHFGSLAFGAFVIAVIQFVRAALLYLDHQTQDVQKSNAVLKVVMKVVQCCLWCLEKCVRFLSKNAYILVAMKGGSFCSSARNAFQILLSNMGQVGTVSTVTFLLLGAGKLAIALGSAIATFAYLENRSDLYGVGAPQELSSPLAPILLALLLAWSVAAALLGVYEMAVDTILLCFCEDKQLNAASGQFFMSDSLKKFVDSVPVSSAKPNAAPAVADVQQSAKPEV